ncbi:hypothetical protein GPALN_007870 [Globodera pallida]|nr:hypothetical protein GPALN_007870 [Globodera pallida]
MWSLTDKERAILRKVIPTEFFGQLVSLPPNNKAETIEEICKRKRLSASDVSAIYASLPPETEFFRFVEALRPCSSAEAIEEMEERMSEGQREAKRNFREALEQLRERQETLKYAEITKSVDASRTKRPLMQDFGKEMRQVNRQLVAVINTLITVGGSFAFGFFGVEFAYPQLRLDVATRMLLGLVLATLVFFADLYFLVKGMEMEEQMRSLFTDSICLQRHFHGQKRRFLCSSSPTTSSTGIASNFGINKSSRLCPLSAIPKDELGVSILHPEANRFTQRIVLISKVCSLGSSTLGLVMIPIITSVLWEPIAERPTVMVFAGVANLFLVFFAMTPLLLHLLTKRFVQNVFFNRKDRIFTIVHYNFFLQKRAIRFSADQLVDAADIPENKRFWLPLATCLVHSHPMLLPLDADSYTDQEAFELLTKNIKPIDEYGTEGEKNE